jgi:hypothetical protein
MTKLLILCPWAVLMLVPPNADAADRIPLGACDAIRIQSPANVAIKGIAQSTKEGLIVGDLSCPVFRYRKIRIPATVIVEVRSYSSDQIKSDFLAIQPSLDSPQLRVVVHGTIECKEALRFDISDDRRDVTGGNGYGSHGLYSCRMTDGRIDSFEALKRH